MKTIKFKILKMSCVGCSGGIEGTLNATKGIKKSEIIFATETAIIEYDENIISKNDIFKIIKSMGYDPIDSQNNAGEEKIKHGEAKNLKKN